MGQTVVGKHRIAGVAQAGQHAQADTRPGGGHIAADDAADHHASQQGHHQGDELALRQRCLPQHGAENDHKGRGQIQQHRRHRQGAHGLALEVDQAQRQDAEQSGAQENGQMLQLDAEHLTVEQGEYDGQDHQRAEVPDEHPVAQRYAHLCEHTVGKTDKAPAHGAEDHVDIGKVLFHRLVLGSVYFSPRSSMI